MKSTNGNLSDVSLDASNGNYSTNKLDDDDITPIKTSVKEQLMNSINTNSTNSFTSNVTYNGYNNQNDKINNSLSNTNTNGVNTTEKTPIGFSLNSNGTEKSPVGFNIDSNGTDKASIGVNVNNGFNANSNGLNTNSSFNSNSNSFSSVNTILGSNITTIVAEIEGEVKKKPRHFVDKTYYIAKEILMTELTYKKDLDVIHVVSNMFFN